MTRKEAVLRTVQVGNFRAPALEFQPCTKWLSLVSSPQ